MKIEEIAATEETDALVAFLATEGIPPGVRLLDVPCGIGRRAFGLAKAGYNVSAVDANEVGIAAARNRVSDAMTDRLTFVASPREALPGLSPDARFDAILCLDHALTRETVEEELAFLSRLGNHAKKDGRLILDFLNRDYIASHPRPFAFHAIGNVEQHEFRRFDPIAGIVHFEWKFYERAGNDLKYRTTSTADLRLIPPHTVDEMLARSGWEVTAFYGGWDRAPVREDRRKFVVIARRARS